MSLEKLDHCRDSGLGDHMAGVRHDRELAGLEPDRRTALRELCRERLPEPPFVVSAKAWVARGAA